MAHWWEHSSPTIVARVRFQDSQSYVGWVCCFSILLYSSLWGFSLGTPVFPSPQKPTFVLSQFQFTVSPISASALEDLNKVPSFLLQFSPNGSWVRSQDISLGFRAPFRVNHNFCAQEKFIHKLTFFIALKNSLPFTQDCLFSEGHSPLLTGGDDVKLSLSFPIAFVTVNTAS